MNLNCDICGGKGELFHVELEGSKLIACSSCASHAKIISKVIERVEPIKKSIEPGIQHSATIKHQAKEETQILIVDNYNTLIKNKRERLNLKQEELAKSINEKESLIQQIENKKIEPTMDVAQKLEKRLNLKLIETYKDPNVTGWKSKDQGPVTLGDVINIKTRKRK